MFSQGRKILQKVVMSPVKYTKVNLTKLCLKHVIVLIMNLTFVVSLYKKVI